MPRRAAPERRPRMRVHVQMQARRVVDVSQEVVLVDESSEDWVVVSCFCVVDGFPIEHVSRVREALWVLVEFVSESEVAQTGGIERLLVTDAAKPDVLLGSAALLPRSELHRRGRSPRREFSTTRGAPAEGRRLPWILRDPPHRRSESILQAQATGRGPLRTSTVSSVQRRRVLPPVRKTSALAISALAR